MAVLGRKTLPIYLTHFLIGMALMLMIDSAGLFGSPIGNTLLILAVTATCAFLGTFIEQVMPQSARDFLFVPNRRRKIV